MPRTTITDVRTIAVNVNDQDEADCLLRQHPRLREAARRADQPDDAMDRGRPAWRLAPRLPSTRHRSRQTSPRTPCPLHGPRRCSRARRHARTRCRRQRRCAGTTSRRCSASTTQMATVSTSSRGHESSWAGRLRSSTQTNPHGAPERPSAITSTKALVVSRLKG